MVPSKRMPTTSSPVCIAPRSSSVERPQAFESRTRATPALVQTRRQTFAQTLRSIWTPHAFKVEQFEVDVLRRLLAAQTRKRRQRQVFFAEKLQFSWLRFVSGLLSLVLVCSDVPRSGLAIRRFPAAYPTLEPDVFQSIGPWFYSVQQLSRATAANATARVWSYKFDTTSIASRAFAEFFQLAAFPDCILYHSHCTSTTLSGAVVFEMLDSIATAASTRAPQLEPLVEPIRVALRTENVYLDRLHHYLLPQLFVNGIWRTNQLLYYPSELLVRRRSGNTHGEDEDAEQLQSLCADFQVRPSMCAELWTNFDRSCRETNAACRAVGLLWTDTLRRLRAVQQRFPTTRVDLTLLESQEDLQRIRGGVSSTGVRKTDVTTIIRARACAHSSDHGTNRLNCSTVFIDEYRYEAGMVYSDVVQWYRVISSLRGVGQLYYYVRIAMLAAFCFCVCADEDAATEVRSIHQRCRFDQQHWRRVWRAGTLFAKTPMQSVIFGSPFPIFCYALAHVIDAAVSYELLGKKFSSQAGLFQLNLRDVLVVGFNQMRSVWLLAAVLHVAIKVSTSRRRLRWSPIAGIAGVPEFLLSGLSSLTIAAQFRSTRFRDTRICALFEVAASPVVLAVTARQNMAHRGSGSTQLGGVWIDLKFFLCVLLVMFVTFAIWRCVVCCFATPSDHRAREALQTRTPVPYSAGTLWPIGAMSVHWTSDYFCVDRSSARGRDGLTLRHLTALIATAKSRRAVAPEPPRSHWRSLASFPARSKDVIADALGSTLPAVLMNTSDFQRLQRQMESLHDRRDDVDATIAFMNLVNVSDPLTYFGYVVRSDGGVLLGYFQSRQDPSRFFLLPLNTDESYYNSHTRDLTLVYSVHSALLGLSEVIQCG